MYLIKEVTFLSIFLPFQEVMIMMIILYVISILSNNCYAYNIYLLKIKHGIPRKNQFSYNVSSFLYISEF